MSNAIYLNHEDIGGLSRELANKLKLQYPYSTSLKAYAVPRGGIPVGYMLKSLVESLKLVEDSSKADIIIDDIIDSGTTRRQFKQPFYALINKLDDVNEYSNKWVVFPWEGTVESGIDENVKRILQCVDPDPKRGGLIETPLRVSKAWKFWTSGYDKDPANVLKVFEDGAENYDQMITVKDIPVYSHCEHHMAAIFGTATVSYIPNKYIVGLSKLSRIVDIFARRLQVQERMTSQIADAINDNLEPIGVGVMIKARHMCMESRGTCQQGHHTITTALRGEIKDDHQTKEEFLLTARS